LPHGPEKYRHPTKSRRRAEEQKPASEKPRADPSRQPHGQDLVRMAGTLAGGKRARSGQDRFREKFGAASFNISR